MDRKHKGFIGALAGLCLIGVAMSLLAQAQAPSDADQINALLAGLSDHSRIPAEVLDPTLSPEVRQENLKHFSAPHYELSLVPKEIAPAITGDNASVPIRVHFDSKDGNSLDASATAQFVRREGQWYFSNFDFMSWPVFLVIVLVVGVLVGIGYASTVLVLRSKLLTRGPLRINALTLFIPYFWPSLFRKAR